MDDTAEDLARGALELLVVGLSKAGLRHAPVHRSAAEVQSVGDAGSGGSMLHAHKRSVFYVHKIAQRVRSGGEERRRAGHGWDLQSYWRHGRIAAVVGAAEEGERVLRNYISVEFVERNQLAVQSVFRIRCGVVCFDPLAVEQQSAEVWLWASAFTGSPS